MSPRSLLLTFGLFIVTAAVNLQVPLYTTYAALAHCGNGVAALAFASYVLGLVPTIVLLGGVSDRVGRKPVFLCGMLCSLLATGCMCLAPSMQTLFVARLLQGVSIALCVGTCTAYLAELSPYPGGQAATLVAFATALGFGGGALSTSITMSYFPVLAPPSYWVVLGLTGLVLVAVAVVAPSLPVRGGPLVRLPVFPVGSLLPGVSIAVAWTVSGTVISLVPSQLRQHGLEVWAGPALFLVNGMGVLVQPLAKRLTVVRSLRAGFTLIPLGYSLMVAGAWLGILPLVLVGAAVGGAAAYGFTYLGGLAAVVDAAGEQKSRATAGYLLFAYMGFGLPSVILGCLADRLGTLQTLVLFSAVLLTSSVALAIWAHLNSLGQTTGTLRTKGGAPDKR